PQVPRGSPGGSFIQAARPGKWRFSVFESRTRLWRLPAGEFSSVRILPNRKARLGWLRTLRDRRPLPHQPRISLGLIRPGNSPTLILRGKPRENSTRSRSRYGILSSAEDDMATESPWLRRFSERKVRIITSWIRSKSDAPAEHSPYSRSMLPR